MQIIPIHANLFYHDGRGPTLQMVHYDGTGAHLHAIEFLNPDAAEKDLKHLLFIKPQVFMFTPEEVENYETAVIDWSRTGKAAMVSLGRSSWLSSFAPRHLRECSHFRAMFYDEFLDVICHDIEVRNGCAQPIS
jgi:hypothetical protein